MMNTQVRLVRCPRCGKVLPELAEVPVYKCGGCGAVLQAKKRKKGTTHGSEGDFSGKEPLSLSDDKETGNSSLNVQSPVENEPHGNSDHHEARSSTELSSHQDPDSSPEARAHIGSDQENHLGHQHKRVDQDQSQSQSQDEDHHQGQAQCQEQDDYQEMDMTDGISENFKDQDDHEMYMIDGVSENCKDEAGFEGSAASSAEKGSSLEHIPYRVEESSQVAVKDLKFKSLIAERLLDTRQKKVVVVDEDDDLSEDETADLSHRRTARRFERVSSVETLENVRSGNMGYYGYEGSVSSFDGNNDDLHLRKNHGNSKGILRRGGFRADSTPDDDSENRYHRAKWRHELPPRCQRGKDSRMRLEEDGPSRIRFNDGFHENLRYSSPPIPENPKLEKLELLRMVQQLQDQLDRTSISNAHRFPSHHVPNHPRYPPRHTQRMAFSGEAGAGAYSPCHNFHPQDRYFSTQLPREAMAIFHNNGAYCSPHCSGHTSPQHYPGSKFSAFSRNEMILDIPKPHLRTKHRSPKKRHIRPIASGAPLIACYRCLEILEMPQSFLLFKKRYHSLRCGACSKVLSFILVNGNQVSQYYPEEMIAAPPSSEVEDYGDTRASRAEPVSCSDRSFQKSYSTETDNAVPLNYADQKFSSRGSSVEEKKKAVMWRDHKIRYQDGMGSVGLGGASSSKKVVSEIEEIEPARSGSPLHRLMGYASPSKVIRG